MTNKKTIIFRVDGSHKLGMGHIVRCTNLAKALKKKGFSPYFVIRNYQESISFLKKHHFQLKLLSSYHKQQAYSLSKIIAKKKASLLIHDILDTSKSYMLTLKNHFPHLKIVNFDDLGEGKHLADLLIDANIHQKYKTPSTLFGPKYIFLKELFATAAKQKKIITNKASRVLISFGGSDPLNITKKAVSAVQKMTNCQFSIILGPGFKNKPALKKQCQPYNHINTFDTITTEKFISLMQESDLCLCSGGITLYETSCLGLPSIIICQAPHEIINTDKFVKAGIVLNLGIGTKVSINKIQKTIDSLIANKILRSNMSKKGKQTIDGLGAQRILSSIDALAKGTYNE